MRRISPVIPSTSPASWPEELWPEEDDDECDFAETDQAMNLSIKDRLPLVVKNEDEDSSKLFGGGTERINATTAASCLVVRSTADSTLLDAPVSIVSFYLFLFHYHIIIIESS
jgi:hypothetical protein